MRVEVVMPQMGESIVEGTIVEWHKNVGDAVERDEDVFTLSTDKVDAEVPSPETGVIVEILCAVGDTVDVGTVVAVLETDPSRVSESTPDTAVAAPATEPEPAPAAVSAPASPTAHKQLPPVESATIGETDKATLRQTRSTPLVRNIAEVNGIRDLSVIKGTGVSGRVTKRDILSYIASASEPVKEAPRVGAERPSRASADRGLVMEGIPAGYAPALVKRPRVHVFDDDRVEDMSRMRSSIAENMLQARRATAHCHTVWEIDVTPIVRARAAWRSAFEERGTRLTYTPFFVAAVVAGLRAYPLLNAAIDGETIVHRKRVNIGVAAAIDDGLIVPVLKDADGLSLFGIARGVADLGDRAKQQKLQPQDVTDGTFTISNAGIWGSLFGVPILVQPQVGILGIGGIKRRFVPGDNDEVLVRSMVYMCLTFDHRIIDGATADGFMSVVQKTLAEWSKDMSPLL